MIGSRGTRRSRHSRRSGYTLDAKLRGRTMRRIGYRAGAVAMLLIALTGSAYALYRGMWYAHNLALARNERFTIREIRIRDGRVKTADMIREYLAYKGITEGSNLFAFDLHAFRDDYLAFNPSVRQMTIRRRLPATLDVSIVERDPIARLGQQSTLVCDREGVVFRMTAGLHALPVIIGHPEPRTAPGQVVTGLVRSAVDVLILCEDPRFGLRVLGVDIRKQDYLLLHVVAPSGIKEVMLAWEGMGTVLNEDARRDLEIRLQRIRQTSMVEQGPHLDATFPDRVFGR